MRNLFCIVCGAPLTWSYKLCSDECADLYVTARDFANTLKEEEDCSHER